MKDKDKTKEHLIEEVLREMPDAVMLTDKEGIIQQWAGKSERIFGYNADEAVGKPFHFFYRPDIKEKAIADLVCAIQEIGEFFDVIPCLRKDGTEMPVEARAKTVYDQEGNPVGLIGINKDLTRHRRMMARLGRYFSKLEEQVGKRTAELKAANEQLQKEEEKYRSLVEQNLDGIYIVQGNSFKFANKKFLDMLGYTWEELQAINLWDTIAPESMGFFRERNQRKERGEKVPEQYEFRIVRKDGSVLDVEVHVREIEYEGQKSYQGCIRDITERKQSEKALLKTEKKLQGLIKHLPEGVCLLDEEHHLALANPAAQEYLSVLAKVAVGEVVSHIGGHAVEEVLATENGRLYEIRIEEPSKRIFEVGARPITEEATGTGWVVMIREVTQQREIQEKAGQQDRLAAVGQLAAGIAHDFNNMLTVMMGSAQILEMKPDIPDYAKEDLKSIFSQGQRAAQLIRQVLDFSRKTVAQKQRVNLIPFLKETVELLERALPETIRITTDFKGMDFIVEANLTQLQQVLTNLSVNARDAMPAGGELQIGVSHLLLKQGERPPWPAMKPGKWVMWTVSDTGIGILPDVIKHIYEPFFTTKQRGEGTGLGLAQVYGIVKQHNGFIDVKSEVRKGTTFIIYLPEVSEAETLSQRPESRVAKGQGETILVVEDEKDVLQVLKIMLEGLSYKVLTAGNGRDALKIYDTYHEQIALVLTDMVMPEMGGIDLFKALKERNPEIQVVVMTGYSPQAEEMSKLLQDVSGILEKPLVLEKVARVVNEILKGNG